MTKTAELEKVEDPTVPNIGELLKSKKDEIQSVAGNALNAKTLLRVALNSIIKNPLLQKCSQASIVLSVMDAAAFGLFPNSLTNEGHLVPFYNSNKKCYECQFMVGYKGLLKMAQNSGAIAGVEVRAVHEKDEFSYGFGLNPHLDHIPATGERGEFTFAYAIVRYKQEGLMPDFDVLSAEDAKAHGMRFSKSKKKNGDLSGPWASDLKAMAMKTVLRKVLKFVPLSTKTEMLVDAVHKDEYQEGVVDIGLSSRGEIQDPLPKAQLTEETGAKEEIDEETGEVKDPADTSTQSGQDGLFEKRDGAEFNDR